MRIIIEVPSISTDSPFLEHARPGCEGGVQRVCPEALHARPTVQTAGDRQRELPPSLVAVAAYYTKASISALRTGAPHARDPPNRL